MNDKIIRPGLLHSRKQAENEPPLELVEAERDPATYERPKEPRDRTK